MYREYDPLLPLNAVHSFISSTHMVTPVLPILEGLLRSKLQGKLLWIKGAHFPAKIRPVPCTRLVN